jgi:hypothetical protein
LLPDTALVFQIFFEGFEGPLYQVSKARNLFRLKNKVFEAGQISHKITLLDFLWTLYLWRKSGSFGPRNDIKFENYHFFRPKNVVAAFGTWYYLKKTK